MSLAGEERTRFGERLEEALADLEAAGLVAVESGTVLCCGPRGSILDGPQVEARCRGRALGHSVEVVASTPSTNDLVLERALAGARPGLVVVAELQTAGRGRRGRPFDSRPGLGIWSTTLLDAPDDPELAPRFSLLAALAVAKAVERLTGTRPKIKWPNDVRIAGRKVSGILVEARTRGHSLFPVAGIGVNVHHLPDEFPSGVRGVAGSVEGQTGVRVERGDLLVEILRELGEVLERDRAGSLDLAHRFASFDEMRDREVAVSRGEETWHGVAAGIEDDGGLLLAVPGQGMRVVRSGEATLHGG
jgi:BirA family biotin operon repressor/biotin-[acetyl-CoA-carboxylase] ligase